MKKISMHNTYTCTGGTQSGSRIGTVKGDMYWSGRQNGIVVSLAHGILVKHITAVFNNM